jgi:hypothetical protein
MNERIRLLAEQARQYAFAKVELTQDPTEWSSKYYNEMFDQKFAELIVRECGVALSPMLRDMISRGQAVELIKKHFGVEE